MLRIILSRLCRSKKDDLTKEIEEIEIEESECINNVENAFSKFQKAAYESGIYMLEVMTPNQKRIALGFDPIRSDNNGT